MAKAPAEMMREFVRSQNFTSTDEVMTAMKDMFKDILQEVMECELADELGYEKSERMSSDECGNKSKNYRNGYSKKTVKTQMGELEIKVPRDRNGEYEPKIISKYNRNADGMEEKILSLYACGMSQRDIAEQIKNLEEQIAVAKEQLKEKKLDLEQKKNRLLDLSIAGALTVEEFKERNDAFNVQILECHGKLTAIRQEENQPSEELDIPAIRQALD